MQRLTPRTVFSTSFKCDEKKIVHKLQRVKLKRWTDTQGKMELRRSFIYLSQLRTARDFCGHLIKFLYNGLPRESLAVLGRKPLY